MGKQWYYNVDNQPVGPIGDKELRELASQRTITTSTLVTTAGGKSWIEAGKVEGLFPKDSAPPPLVVPPVSLAPLPAINQPAFVLTGSTQAPITGFHPQHSSRSNAVIFAVCGTIAICALAVIAYGFLGRDSERGATTSSKTEKTQTNAHRDVEAGSVQTHDNETDLLGKEKKVLKDQVDELKKEKEKLLQEIKDLSASVDTHRKWKSIDFALINPTHFAVGLLATSEGTFQVVSKSEGKGAEEAIRIATKSKIPRIGNDRQLTRRVFQESKIGETVNEVLAKEIRSKCWKEHRYCPFEPDVVPKFIVYTDLVKSRQRIGFLESETPDAITFWGLSPKSETIRRELIQPGSARKSDGEEVLEVIGDMDLLDYCVFNIAQRVGSKSGEVGHRDLSVKVKFEVLDEALANSKTIDDRKVDDFFEFFDRILGTPFKGDKRKEGVRMLREAEKSLENEAYFKLTKMGLPVVERERLDLIREERSLGGQKDFASDYGKLACASHIVLLEISRSDTARYALSVRLLDVDNGRVVWAMMGDRTNAKSKPKVSQYQLPSGRLCMITPKVGTSPKEFSGLEVPPVLEPLLLKKNSDVRSHIVTIESSAEAELVSYRPLFGKQSLLIPQTSIESIGVLRDIGEVPKLHPELFRCIVWKLAKGIIPPAGRIEQTDDGKIVVGIGRSAGVVPETKFRVVRPVGSSLSSQDEFLPIELVVAQLRGEDCDVNRIRDSSLVARSASESEQSLTGAFAVSQTVPLTNIVIHAPLPIDPPRKIANELYTNRAKQQQLIQKTHRASTQIQEKLASAFRQLGIPVESGKSAGNEQVVSRLRNTPAPTPPSQSQGSHFLGGTITLATENRYQLDIGFKRQENGSVIEHLVFDLSDVQLH